MNLFSTLSLRAKLLFGYLLTFLASVIIGNLIILIVVHSTIETSTERELANTTNTIMNMVKSAADASIKNYLRAVAEKNREIIQHFYDDYQAGNISEEEAKSKATAILLSQAIGKTGYIYCVDTKGILAVHPKINGTDLSKYEFIREQIKTKEGYLEYEWANPDEGAPRKKALYMTYFGPWDWIISVSSYREEFKSLLNVDDFRNDILAVSFGKTGYPYVIDSKGTLVIHPKLQGRNIFNARDIHGHEFIKEIIDKKSGKIIYPWQNPGEMEPREKLVLFSYIPEFDWIVASSSYLEEFNEPLTTIGYATFATLIIVVLLTIPITWFISSSINRPIQDIIQGFSQGAQGDYSSRIQTSSGDELGQLAKYYNDFMDKLSESNRSLQTSEERFRLLFENAVEGVFTMTANGQFLRVNPSMTRMMGYESQNLLLQEVAKVGARVYIEDSELERLLANLAGAGAVTGFETMCRQRDGAMIWVSLNARAYTDSEGLIATIDGFCNDVTARKQAENAQKRIKEELEQRVAERTAELSNYIGQLEQRNIQESLLRETGELLQVCHSTRESYAIIDDYVGRFFPRYRGALFLLDATKDRFEQVVVWGAPIGIEPEFSRDECWALRKGKPYSVGDKNQRLFCSHLNTHEPLGYLCVPIIAQGEVLGLLHIQSLPDQHAEWVTQVDTVQGLASIFTNNLGLAMANLKLQDRLRDQSMRDPLTSLFNRRFMEEFTEQEIRRTKRYNTSVSLVMLDVDHFKTFNDTHGHDAGDLVLKELAVYLLKNCRESDVVCRYGGEEFVIILPTCPLDDAVTIAQKLCNGVREQMRVSYRNQVLAVTISMGVAACPTHAAGLDTVLKAADQALYEAKHGGRARVAVAGGFIEAES